MNILKVKPVNKLELLTKSAKETEKLGVKFSRNLKNGDCIALIGELGSGKTCFTKGIARGIGVKDIVSSPTFKIISEYDASAEGRTSGKNVKFYHVDFYRITNYDELMNLGLEDLFFDDGIVVIEWPDKFLDYLPDNFIEVKFSIINNNTRRIIIRRCLL